MQLLRARPFGCHLSINHARHAALSQLLPRLLRARRRNLLLRLLLRGRRATQTEPESAAAAEGGRLGRAAVLFELGQHRVDVLERLVNVLARLPLRWPDSIDIDIDIAPMAVDIASDLRDSISMPSIAIARETVIARVISI